MQRTRKIKADLAEDFGINVEERISKEQLIAALTLRISELLRGNPEQLFSLLYRLDISEQKLKNVLQGATDYAGKIALLIYERQIEKAISREKHPGERPDDELAW